MAEGYHGGPSEPRCGCDMGCAHCGTTRPTERRLIESRFVLRKSESPDHVELDYAHGNGWQTYHVASMTRQEMLDLAELLTWAAEDHFPNHQAQSPPVDHGRQEYEALF